ncbi:MAG: hypothetical protein HGA95_00665 [Caldiserica bacterium]|nr:hypothetical protein [Caldisericota bacterium]
MVDFELESKFVILKNPKAIQDEVLEWIGNSGYIIKESKPVEQVDVYLDRDMQIYKSGFSLRERFVNGLMHNITLKTLDKLDDNGIARIEEEGKTFPELLKLVAKKVKSIYQSPVDETVINLINNVDQLMPSVIILNHREKCIISNGRNECEIAFDTASSLFPVISRPFRELEIEGPKDFDNIRLYVVEKYGHGRWRAIERSETSKFEFGLKAGGLI